MPATFLNEDNKWPKFHASTAFRTLQPSRFKYGLWIYHREMNSTHFIQNTSTDQIHQSLLCVTITPFLVTDKNFQIIGTKIIKSAQDNPITIPARFVASNPPSGVRENLNM